LYDLIIIGILNLLNRTNDHHRPEIVDDRAIAVRLTLQISGDLCPSFTVEKTGHWKSLVIVGFEVGGGL
jgi:hypothetical protein